MVMEIRVGKECTKKWQKQSKRSKCMHVNNIKPNNWTELVIEEVKLFSRAIASGLSFTDYYFKRQDILDSEDRFFFHPFTRLLIITQIFCIQSTLNV